MSSQMTIYNTIKEIYFWLDYGDRQVLDAFKLNVPRFYLLKHIYDNPGISFTKLSVLMISDKSNITRLIQAVEADGLVERKPHDTDRRTWTLFLTEMGKDVLVRAIAAHEAFTQERFASVHENGDLLKRLIEVRQALQVQIDQRASQPVNGT